VSEKAVTHRHDRAASGRRFVYVVRSRRSGGLSVGINLDPQKTCNFDCVYCEVIDRRAIAERVGRPPIAAADVAADLAAALDRLRGGPEAPRDIAFAGDGEPSTFPGFLPLSRLVFDVRDAAGFGLLPVILITNGSGLARPGMREAHDLFASRGGEFWIKLDAGTEPFYRTVCRTSVPFERILSNLLSASRRHPVVVQSMFFLSGPSRRAAGRGDRRLGRPPRGRRGRRGRDLRRAGLHRGAGDDGGRRPPPARPGPRGNRDRCARPAAGRPGGDVPLSAKPG
jgi:hypothetical protein